MFTSYAVAACRDEDAQVLVGGDRSGAAIWFPPDGWKTSVSDYVRIGPQVVRAFGPGIVRGLRLLAAAERQHPTEPHWYLEALGLVPEARGSGAGPTLLLPVLHRCDADRVPAYLESTDPRNVPFFERQGFVPRGPLDVPAGCPVVTPMWRDPY